MLNGGIILLSLQSWCFRHVHGPEVFFLEGYIVWLEEHGFGLSEGDDGCLVSLKSLGETNREMIFPSSTGLWLGLCFAIGISRQGIGVAEAVVPNFLSRPSWEVFS
jgi:hypothetical protein